MTDTTMNTGAASLSDDLNPEIVKETAQFIGKITGLVPPPHDAFPPEWHGYLRVFTKRLYEIAGMNATPAVHAIAAPGELREAARQFHNLTQGDSTVIIRAPSAEKRDAIIAAGERLRAAIAAGGAQEPVKQSDARYVVIGYGETDHPQAAFINEREQLLDAVLGMMYTHASDADSEIRGAYAKDLADDDEWSEGIWSTEFEIGGITIYDLGYGSAASNGEQA